MANDESSRPDTVKTLGAIFGLLAGAVGLLYAIGGGALALRLYLAELPSVTVVAQLPREYLISIGLTQIVLPAAAAAALYASARLLLGSAWSPPTRFLSLWSDRSASSRTGVVIVAALIALVATIVPALPAIGRDGLPANLAGVLAVAFVVTLLVLLVALRLRAVVAAHYAVWNQARPIGWMTLVVGLAVLPSCLVFSGTFHFLDTKVCVPNAEKIGVLVGETADRVYVGDPTTQSPPRRVTSIPVAQVKQVLIGGDAATTAC